MENSKENIYVDTSDKRGREGLIKLHSLREVKATCNYMYDPQIERETSLKCAF